MMNPRFIELSSLSHAPVLTSHKATKGSRNEYEAIIEVTDPHAIRLLKSGKLPRYVSPSIYRLNINDRPSAITDYEPINLTIVDSPAYGIQVANVRSMCEDTSPICQRILSQSASMDITTQIQDLKELEKGVDRLQTNITRLQKQVDDLVDWKELTETEMNNFK